MEQCCAIDYILHTLDSATALLNTSRAFPSRLQIPQSSHRHFSSLARRLGRIFAHAYFHHREAFEQAEAESSLYARFLALTSKFDLVPPEFLVIPARVTDHEHDDRGNLKDRDFDVQPPRLLAAAVDPRAAHEGEADFASRQQQQQTQSNAAASCPGQWERRGSVVPPVVVTDRPKNDSPPGLGSESPRKMGRSRTDTMVLHEAFVVAEEMAKADRAEAAQPEQAEDTANGPSRTANPGPMAIDVPDMPDELLEDFPKTAKPRSETIKETQYSTNSLPGSPIIKSPAAPSTSTLPDDAVQKPSEAPSTEAETNRADADREALATAALEPTLEPEPEVASTSTCTSPSTEPESSLGVPGDVQRQSQPTPLTVNITEDVTTAALPSSAFETVSLPSSETMETRQIEEEEAAAAPRPELQDMTEEAPVAEKDVVAASSETNVDATEEEEALVEDIPSISFAVEEIVEAPKEAHPEPKVEAEFKAEAPFATASDEKASEAEQVSEPEKPTAVVNVIEDEPSDEPSKDLPEHTAPA
ncbi:hypothetical protein DXG03_004784 [Asterophora parasitica]|uniref:Mob1/phocein n=1 Tax=Asterophora parasitica TaxID=117018 RepID=A0A9P7G6D5_9AGAR|nr:hypothetical protein DXG03_004784 [Asterophora parasitica]